MNSSSKLKIGGSNQVLIVAELSGNHNHDFDLALKTVKAAKDAGADAFKLQTFTPDTITLNCNNKHFIVNSGQSYDGRTLYDVYKELNTPWEWHQKIKDYVEELGMVFFSTSFDFSSVDFLEGLDVPCHKIASFEITDIPLIEYAASKGKPIIISTGIAAEEDIKLAVEACIKVKNENIILLKCTSSYPAKIEEANLLTLLDFKSKFNVEVGLSDHTMGDIVAITATALGAKLVEKHFILDRNLGGIDAEFSMEPEEFRRMVNSIRDVEKSLGDPKAGMNNSSRESRKYARSLFAVKDIKAGEKITPDNVKSVRPGNGLHPKFYYDVIGKYANCNLEKGTPFSLDFIK